ncbi:hypothetical protein LCGC14_2863200, partial [marine sediment metagenome]
MGHGFGREDMIVHPLNWREIGQPISVEKIEDTLLEIVADTHCRNIAFSGGIDSSLLVHFMLEVGIKPVLYTIGESVEHPDVIHSMIASKHFRKTEHHIYIPEPAKCLLGGSADGDTAVRLLYEYARSKGVVKMIAGDGIDEFMCGYYAHQNSPTPEVYYDFLGRLCSEHLEQLNINSGNVDVYLPYIDSRMVILLAQIPIERKVDGDFRKKLMVEMAQRAGLPESVIYRRKYGFC